MVTTNSASRAHWLTTQRRRPGPPGWSAGSVSRTIWMVSAALCATALGSEPASAQFFWFEDTTPKYRKVRPAVPLNRPVRRIDDDATRSPAKKVETEFTGKTPLLAVISLDDQRLSAYGADGLITRSKVSTGTRDHPTPTGLFAVIQKSRWHESNIYSGAAMPFMQRLTWTGVAMHQGILPGYPASHGCVRLPAAFAAKWFAATRMGLRVVIAPDDITPRPIAHSALPEPRYWVIPASAEARSPIQAAGLTSDSFTSVLAQDVRQNPVDYAASERAKARSDLKAIEKTLSRSEAEVEAADKATKAAQLELKAAERDVNTTRERLAFFGLAGNRPAAAPRADYGEGIMVAIANSERANSRLGAALIALETAKVHHDAVLADRKAAADAANDLKQRVADLGRRQEVVSILISRKDKRLYVRQALRSVFDVPFELREPDRPIGTHVMVAAAPAAGTTELRWQAVSLPPERPKSKARSGRDRTDEADAVAAPAETLEGALSRIEWPAGVRERLAEYVWDGASFIVTDAGLPKDLPVGLDFIVETRH